MMKRTKIRCQRNRDKENLQTKKARGLAAGLLVAKVGRLHALLRAMQEHRLVDQVGTFKQNGISAISVAFVCLAVSVAKE